MGRMRAAACLLAVSLTAGPRAAAGPVPPGMRPAASAAPGDPASGPDDPGAWAMAQEIPGGSGDGAQDPAVPEEPLAEDPGAYRGYGYADKRANPFDYRDRARASALAQISRQISVTIQTESRLSRRESPAGSASAWSESTALSSEAALSGFRLEKSRETAEGYWAVYALDKEEYARGRERAATGRAAWLRSGAEAIEDDLGARRLQSAWDRAATVEDSLARLPEIPPGAEGAFRRFERAVARLREAVRGSRWAESGAWRYALPIGGRPRPERPRIRLLDAGGMEWKGPWRVAITDIRRPDDPACEAWTDAEGRLDPAGAFQGCGLEGGIWRVAWPGSAAAGVFMEVEAVWQPLEVRLELACDPGTAGWASDPAALGRIRAGLALRCGPRYRAGPGENLPVLEFRVTSATLDSLEGIHFATLRGELRVPGARVPHRLAGKGGHADPARARERALGDLLEAAGKSIRSD